MECRAKHWSGFATQSSNHFQVPVHLIPTIYFFFKATSKHPPTYPAPPDNLDRESIVMGNTLREKGWRKEQDNACGIALGN